MEIFSRGDITNHTAWIGGILIKVIEIKRLRFYVCQLTYLDTRSEAIYLNDGIIHLIQSLFILQLATDQLTFQEMSTIKKFDLEDTKECISIKLGNKNIP